MAPQSALPLTFKAVFGTTLLLIPAAGAQAGLIVTAIAVVVTAALAANAMTLFADYANDVASMPAAIERHLVAKQQPKNKATLSAWLGPALNGAYVLRMVGVVVSQMLLLVEMLTPSMGYKGALVLALVTTQPLAWPRSVTRLAPLCTASLYALMLVNVVVAYRALLVASAVTGAPLVSVEALVQLAQNLQLTPRDGDLPSPRVVAKLVSLIVYAFTCAHLVPTLIAERSGGSKAKVAEATAYLKRTLVLSYALASSFYLLNGALGAPAFGAHSVARNILADSEFTGFDADACRLGFAVGAFASLATNLFALRLGFDRVVAGTLFGDLLDEHMSWLAVTGGSLTAAASSSIKASTTKKPSTGKKPSPQKAGARARSATPAPRGASKNSNAESSSTGAKVAAPATSADVNPVPQHRFAAYGHIFLLLGVMLAASGAQLSAFAQLQGATMNTVVDFGVPLLIVLKKSGWKVVGVQSALACIFVVVALGCGALTVYDMLLA